MSYKGIIDRIRKIENEVSKYWLQNNIVIKVLNKEGDKKFYFLDGPPYVTERIHIGTAWNKVLKDCILRYKRLCNYYVWSIPGYDTHGLPIEVTVEKWLGIKNKKEIIEKIGIDDFNKKCLELVKRNMNIITEQFKNLAVWMKWDSPYVTYDGDYVSSVWWVIKKAHDLKLLDKDLRVFHWCPRCETVLSEHEVSMGYKDVESPSIYVKFPLVDDQKTSLLIWTTTPWTLPSNVATAVHPDYLYALIELKNGEKLIVMEARLDKVINEEYKIISVFHGKDLKGKRYVNPLKQFVNAQKHIDAHYVIISEEYVSPEEGTGLVHIAPEHGKEDFELGKQYNLPIVSIVDNRGYFTKDAGKYAGTYILDADPIIIEDLRKLGCLYKEEKKIHRYPFCWRCHTPLFMKTTTQWIIKLSQIKEKLISENKKIKWIPKWAGEQRFGLWLETARDWVITRQRYWGTPAPIWQCDTCSHIEVIGSIEELQKKGFDIKNPHRPYIDNVSWKCPNCDKGFMRRIPDVLDVWIDSGAAPWASIKYPKETKLFEKLWPVDFITEGHDQTRGWFYAMLCLGIIAFDRSPYKTVLVHGFTLDEQGRGMHKSLGNVIYPEEFTEKYCIDPFRIYLLTHTIWEDMLTLHKRLEDILRTLNIIINTYEFYKTYAELDNYIYKDTIKCDELMEEDTWIISKFEKTLDEVTRNMENYHIHLAIKRLLDFVVEDLSRKYIKIIRRRVWIEEEDPRKTAVYDTLHYILKRIAILLSPFAPHISEYLYIFILSNFDKDLKESVHMESWPVVNRNIINEKLIKNYEIMWYVIASINAIRQKHGIKTRQPLYDAVIPQDIYDKLTHRMKEIIMEQSNIRKINVITDEDLVEYIEFEIKPNMKALGPKYGKFVKTLVDELTSLSNEKILNLLRGKAEKIQIDKEIIELGPEDLNITLKAKDPYDFVKLDDKIILLNIKIDRELLYEGIARDIVRRIQQMRKDLNLDILDKIITYILTNNKEIIESIRKYQDYISHETRSKEIILSELPSNVYSKDWKINNTTIKIGILKE